VKISVLQRKSLVGLTLDDSTKYFFFFFSEYQGNSSVENFYQIKTYSRKNGSPQNRMGLIIAKLLSFFGNAGKQTSLMNVVVVVVMSSEF
jgi:hypothetical protein